VDSRLGFNNLIQFDEKIQNFYFYIQFYGVKFIQSGAVFNFPIEMHGKKIILKMCLETHVADETKTTTMKFLLEQCLSYIYQVQFHQISLLFSNNF
jgi:hypothetical protein